MRTRTSQLRKRLRCRTVEHYRRLPVNNSARRLRLSHDSLAHGTRFDRERDGTVRTKHLGLLDSLANYFWSHLQYLSAAATQHSSYSLLTVQDCNYGNIVQRLAGPRHDSHGPTLTRGRISSRPFKSNHQASARTLTAPRPGPSCVV